MKKNKRKNTICSNFKEEFDKLAKSKPVQKFVKTYNKTIKKKPFESFVDLDEVTYNCPCGDSISGEGDEIGKFIKKHKKHTNGYCKETITDDGMRFYSKSMKRTSRFKIK